MVEKGNFVAEKIFYNKNGNFVIDFFLYWIEGVNRVIINLK